MNGNLNIFIISKKNAGFSWDVRKDQRLNTCILLIHLSKHKVANIRQRWQISTAHQIPDIMCNVHRTRSLHKWDAMILKFELNSPKSHISQKTNHLHFLRFCKWSWKWYFHWFYSVLFPFIEFSQTSELTLAK